MSDDNTRPVRDFLADAVPFLRCPVCRAGLAATDAASLRCASGHSFDIARQGYVNLLPGGAHPGTADTAEMVAARERFLTTSHFACLREFICDAAQRALVPRSATERAVGDRGAAVERSAEGEPVADGCVLEVGAGTGYYLAALLDRLPDRAGLALDISKFAARRAARAHERIGAIVCDAWDVLPVAEACAALVVDIFAPRNPPELRRVLQPHGVLLVVTPAPEHLRELVGRLGLLKIDERKPERLETALGADFVLVERTRYEERLQLSPTEAAALAAMGPSAHHISASELMGRLAPLPDPIEATLAVVVSTYRPRLG